MAKTSEIRSRGVTVTALHSSISGSDEDEDL
jgi:hypothetical protein